MRGIHIVGTGRALPEKILTNEDIEQAGGYLRRVDRHKDRHPAEAYLRAGDLCVACIRGGKKSTAGGGGKGTGKTGGNWSGGRCNGYLGL